MNPIKSIISMHQSYVIKNFEKSGYAKNIKKFRNLHAGERCFIIGNGPSLRAEDLDRLAKNNEISFAFNRIFKIFEQTKWQPTYYISEDEILLKGIQKEVNELSAKTKFIPLQMKFYHEINVNKALYFNLNYDDKKRYNHSFSPDCAAQIDCNGTVTITAIQMAAYMGFSKIYLLGIDHNFQKIIDENGNEIVDNNVKNYFVDGYDDDVKDQVVHDLGNTTRSYKNAKAYCDENNIKVFNATRTTKLDVFPLVDFDSLF